MVGRSRAYDNSSFAHLALKFWIWFYWVQVEKLIKELPSFPADWSNGDLNFIEKGHLSNGMQHGENGTNIREAQSMLLEWIASEMSRLKFYIIHAQVYLALISTKLIHNPWLLSRFYDFRIISKIVGDMILWVGGLQ